MTPQATPQAFPSLRTGTLPKRLVCLLSVPLCWLFVPETSTGFSMNSPSVIADEQASWTAREPRPTTTRENRDPTSNLSGWGLLAELRKVHPLVLAAAQLLVVLGICLLLTDNQELEIYLKIDFRPPPTDILK